MKTFKVLQVLLLASVLVLSNGCSNSSETEVDSITSTPLDFEFSQKVPDDGLEEKSQSLAYEVVLPKLMKSEGVFAMAVTPQDLGFSLISLLPEYYSKKYTDAEIKEKFKLESLALQGKDSFFINILFQGDYSNTSSVSMDDDFYEYFFLENEDGDYVRSLAQERQGLLTEVNYLHTLGTVVIQFDSDEVEKMMKDHETMYLTFDGLKLFQENKMEIEYPYSKYYSEIFPEISVMIDEMGL